jgi:hypothetical protein
LFYGLAFTLIGVLGLCERASVIDPVSTIAVVIGLTISAWTSLSISTRLDIYRRQISELYSIIEELIDDKS